MITLKSTLSKVYFLLLTFDEVIKSDFRRSDYFNGDFQQSVITYGFDQLYGFRQSDIRRTDVFPFMQVKLVLKVNLVSGVAALPGSAAWP